MSQVGGSTLEKLRRSSPEMENQDRLVAAAGFLFRIGLALETFE